MASTSRSRIVGSLALMMAALIFGTSVALAPEAAALGTITTLTSVQGDVLVRHHGADFVAAREGDLVAAGDTLRTGVGAHAEVTYFEGSSVQLDAETEIVIEALATEPDGGTVVAMWQTVGRTWHVVTKLITTTSRYQIRTPSSTASVRGTIFAVDVRVDADGVSATVTTTEGVVVHSAPDPATPGATTEVRVAAGQASTRASGKAAEPLRAAPPALLQDAPTRPTPSSDRTWRSLVSPADTTRRTEVQSATDTRAKPEARSSDRDRANEPRDRAKPVNTPKSQSPGDGKR